MAPSTPARDGRRRGPSRGLANRLRHAFGMRQTLVVGGVRYREITIEPLRRALSRKGRGHKDYDVTFADGSSLRIRCTPERVYADLAPSPLAPVCERTEAILRPGKRVLIVGGGTGDAGAYLARRVAPSGAVVSLETDRESVEYAQKRYRLPNASFEVGGIDGLAGETDGAFDAVMAIEPVRADADPEKTLAELWRVVAPAGWLMLAAAPGPRTDQAVGCLGTVADLNDGPTIVSDGKDGWIVAVSLRPPEP